MKKAFTPWLKTIFWFPFFFAHASGQDPLPELDPKDLEVKLATPGPAPYPFQAARLRLSVRNIANKKVGPLPLVDESYQHTFVSGPMGQAYFWPNLLIKPVVKPIGVIPKPGIK